MHEALNYLCQAIYGPPCIIFPKNMHFLKLLIYIECNTLLLNLPEVQILAPTAHNDKMLSLSFTPLCFSKLAIEHVLREFHPLPILTTCFRGKLILMLPCRVLLNVVSGSFSGGFMSPAPALPPTKQQPAGLRCTISTLTSTLHSPSSFLGFREFSTRYFW
jgi:hypothetical protein